MRVCVSDMVCFFSCAAYMSCDVCDIDITTCIQKKPFKVGGLWVQSRERGRPERVREAGWGFGGKDVDVSPECIQWQVPPLY